jgi:hypothetical protein
MMDTVKERRTVEADLGDLSEAMEAASAWAYHLRVRGGVVRQNDNADRIIKAVDALREQSESTGRKVIEVIPGGREWV